MAGRDLYGRTLGEFVLREQIGEGGYGIVYRAEQPALGRDVVVKVLHEGRGDAGSVERFLREAQLAAQLDHPYAAHVYASGCDDKEGWLWIAMERVRGITLADWLEIYGPMPVEQYVPFFECIAEVVHAAHARRIVHRDLKPSNIMVTGQGIRLCPKLLDFGIAKMSPDVEPLVPEDPDDAFAGDDEAVCASGDDVATARVMPQRGQRIPTNRLTPSGKGFGSLPYMAPEQWRNAKAVGPGADIYALGVVSFEALTGRLPFIADSPDEYCRLHHAKLPPGLHVEPRRQLDRVIQRALAKGPQGRHCTVLEMAKELRHALQTTKREQLRSAAQQWEDEDRAPDLLWGRDMLAELELQVSPEEFSESECSFVADSYRRVRRIKWIKRSLAVLAAATALVIAVMQIRLAHEQTRDAQERARMAQHFAALSVTQAEVEEGRQGLLLGEPGAEAHLAEAYKREHLPSTAFMLARALQPRLAEQARLASSAGRMWSAMFSPDGARLVTADDQNAQIWDAHTCQLLFTLHHGDTVYQAVYSNDEARIITASGDGAIRIWDATNGTLTRELRQDGMRRYAAVAALPDVRLVAAIDVMGEVVHVWDAGTGALLAELRGEPLEFHSIAFSADSHWLAASIGNDVRVFDVRTWAHVRTLDGQHRLSWDPTGPRLLTGSGEGDVSIWEIPSGSRLRHLREIGEPVNRVAFSPNGELVVAASEDGAEQIWNATSGKLQSQGNYLRGKILSVEFDPTSKLLVAAGASGAVAVTEAAEGMPISMLEGPGNVVMVAHFDPSSRRVVGASWDGTARIWDATAPYRRWGSPPISKDCGLVTSLEPDRRFLAIGCKDHPTRVWDTARDQLLAELPSVTPAGGDFASAYPAVSVAGDRAAIARGSTVEVYELPSGRLLRTIAHGAPVNTVAFASTGRDIVSGAVDGSLLVTRDDGALLTFPTSSGGIDAAGFMPDGRVVSADAQRRLRVYAPGGAVLADLKISARVRTLRMSLDSHRLVTVSNFIGKVAPPELWDLEHYHRIAQLDGQGQVFSARFVAGGQILTACSDGAARLWDAAMGQLRQTYRGGSRFLADVTLSSDGSMIVGGGGDGLLRFWDAVSGRPLWTMPAHRSHLVGVRVEGSDIVTRGYFGDISRWTLPKPEQVIEACSDHKRCAMVSR